ncbi:MAG: hypothetical protein Q7T44_07990 [Parvibaculum sp.]|nr:hypothetical protein [Parvibaculum sp.]
MISRFALAQILGVVVFAITLWLGVLSPKTIAHPVAGDARDPIIAFEMVSTPDELVAAIGESRAGFATLREAIDKVNRIDFLYMTVYGAFIAVFFMGVAQQRNDRRWLIVSVLGILAMLADVRENMVLLALTQDGADVLPLITALVNATWIKWFSLGIAALAAGYAIYEDTSMPTMRLIALIVGVSAAGATVASWYDPVKFPQYMALAIFVTWIMQVIYAYRVGKAPNVAA